MNVGSPCLDCVADAVGENSDCCCGWKVSCVVAVDADAGVRGGVLVVVVVVVLVAANEDCAEAFREPGLSIVTVLGIEDMSGEGSLVSCLVSSEGAVDGGADAEKTGFLIVDDLRTLLDL